MQLLKDLFDWVSWFGTQCIYVVFYSYAFTVKFLPDFIKVTDDHAWWHNFLLVVFWLGLYVFLALKYYKLAKLLKFLMEDSAEDRYGFEPFPFWHWLCYIAAALTPISVSYFAWPPFAVWVMVPLIGGPLLYLIIRGGLGFPLLVLRQVAIILLYIFGIVVFFPFAILIGVIAALALFFGGAGSIISSSTRESQSSIMCPHCGASMVKGSTCPCGRSIAT